MTARKKCRVRGGRSRRHGVSLIEILIGLTLLSIVLSSLAALSFRVGRSALDVGRKTYDNAYAARLANQLSVLPFDSLPPHAGCTSALPYTTCVAVSDTTAELRRVMVVTTSTLTSGHADTVVIYRSKPPEQNPLNTP